MKRNFTYFATLVLSLLMAAPVQADQQSLAGAGGELVTAPVEGKYYVIQGNGQAVSGRESWLYDNNGTFAATVATSMPTGVDAMKYVWTFEVTGEGYAAKNLNTGRYIYIKGTSSGGAVEMSETPNYFTIEVGTGDCEGYLGFKNASGQYIDMGNTGASPCTWGDGLNSNYTSRRLSIFIAEIEELTDQQAALLYLDDCFAKYQTYYNGDKTFERGTEIGQYACTDEEYNLFIENMKTAELLVAQAIERTAEEIYEIIQNIENGYKAIVASLVKLTIANGNYRIVSAMEWTQTDRIPTGEYDENEQEIFEEVVTHPTKAMYALLNEDKAMWANIDETDCRYLWQLTNVGNSTDSVFMQMKNIATDGILATCSQSKQATLAADSETKMYFQFIRRTKDGKLVLAMKPSTGGDSAFLHCNEHGGGTGKASNIVGWTAGAGASNWILEPVSDEEVEALVDAYAPIKNHEILVTRFKETISETEDAIALAKDDSYITDRGEGLITSTDQFSSPYTDPTEGSFDNVLQESGYWHSSYQNGNVAMHTHYFEVAFDEPIEADNIQCFMRRRSGANNDHITALGVFGSDGEENSEWTEIGTFDLSKNATQGQTTYSNYLALNGSYKTLRFYIDKTTNNRGYGHFAQFQLYPVTVDGNTQWSQMGEVATAIETALATAKTVDQDEMVMADYEALKTALETFKAVLVDPSPLAEAIEANKGTLDLVAVGEAPGFWSEDSNVATFTETLEEAIAYLKSGAFTQAETEAYTAAIKNGAGDVFAAANPVEPGKWYALKYDSEENFEAHGWSKDGATGNDLGDLWGSYAATANIETEGEGENQTKSLVSFSSLEDITVGQTIRFINEDIIEEMDQVAFRFVAQGDSAYAIQHKSGLYLNGNVRSTGLTLGLAPALFNVRAVGYGKVVIEVRKLNGKGYYTEPVYLHAAEAGHSLVTWNDDAVSSNSALYIEPIDEGDFDEGDEAQESMIMNATPNSIIFMCYPMGFSVVDGAEIYAYQGAIPADDNQAHYAFNKIEQAEPGQPVLLVVGDREDFVADDPEEEPEEIEISLVGETFAVNPLTTGGVHGTYAYEWVDEGTVVVYGGTKKFGVAGNALVLAEGKDATDCTRDISANTGYIVYGENILKDASVDSFDLVITGPKGPEMSIVGDLNGDEKIDIADAVTVLNIMAADQYDTKADVNNDGKIDIADFVTILNIMAAQ